MLKHHFYELFLLPEIIGGINVQHAAEFNMYPYHKNVTSISVHIYTAYGEPVPFTDGQTTITLEFHCVHSSLV